MEQVIVADSSRSQAGRATAASPAREGAYGGQELTGVEPVWEHGYAGNIDREPVFAVYRFNFVAASTGLIPPDETVRANLETLRSNNCSNFIRYTFARVYDRFEGNVSGR